MNDRRAHSRRRANVVARVAASSEQRLPRAVTIDISRGGVLLAFDEPIGFPTGHRLVMSLDLPNGHFHALGHITRLARGDDFRTYVAMEFVRVRDEDYDDLARQLDDLDRGIVPRRTEDDDDDDDYVVRSLRRKGKGLAS